MNGDDFIVVPVLALVSSGAAGVALAPRNRSARLLLAAGGSGAASYVLMPLAAHRVAATPGTTVVRTLAELCFLLFVATLTGTLMTFPDGRFEVRWQRQTSWGLVAAAVLCPLAQALGSARLLADGDTSGYAPNPLALRGFEPLGRVAGVVSGTEPLWVLVGFAAMLVRYRRADPERRRELVPVLGSLAGLMVLLVPIAVDSAGGPGVPEPGFQYVFLAALSMMPIVLLVGISRRTRTLADDLSASRVRLVYAEDEVRRRIERDLHDGVQQQLVAVLSLTELASRQARGRSPELTATLDDVRHQVTDAIEQLRELVHGIRPPVLEDSGVAAALESRMRRLPAEVTLDLATADGRWPSRTESAAYFVACEAVTNALKHAPGAPVRVRLRSVGGDLVVEVEDEGPGIAHGRERGGGLLGMRDRVDSSGGALSVLPGRLGGTLVRAEFPA